jgi:hypothetical protein
MTATAKGTAMRDEHLAIDGSVVEVEVEGDARTAATATGWAVVPSLGRSHPFSISPAGHSSVIESAVRAGAGAVTVLSVQEFSIKNGRLRVAEIEMPTATGTRRMLTVGAWEGEGGCLTTSLAGRDTNRLVEVFDTLQFRPRRNGLAIDSRVVPTPRAPELIKEVPGLGLLSIRPALPLELERVPRGAGFRTPNGELFRYRAGSRALLHVGRSAITRITPVDATAEEEIARRAATLRAEWRPRAAA